MISYKLASLIRDCNFEGNNNRLLRIKSGEGHIRAKILQAATLILLGVCVPVSSE